MQNTNTVSSKTNLNLTGSLWDKGIIPAIRETEPHHFVSQALCQRGYQYNALNTKWIRN